MGKVRRLDATSTGLSNHSLPVRFLSSDNMQGSPLRRLLYQIPIRALLIALIHVCTANVSSLRQPCIRSINGPSIMPTKLAYQFSDDNKLQTQPNACPQPNMQALAGL